GAAMCVGSRASASQSRRNDGDGGRRDAGNAGRLAEGSGPDLAEAFDDLPRKPGDAGVLEVVGNRQRLVALDLCDLRLLAAQITRVLELGFEAGEIKGRRSRREIHPVADRGQRDVRAAKRVVGGELSSFDEDVRARKTSPILAMAVLASREAVPALVIDQARGPA